MDLGEYLHKECQQSFFRSIAKMTAGEIKDKVMTITTTREEVLGVNSSNTVDIRQLRRSLDTCAAALQLCFWSQIAGSAPHRKSARATHLVVNSILLDTGRLEQPIVSADASWRGCC